jgi:hypothetical protein
MNAKELSKQIDKLARFDAHGMTFHVQIIDVKIAWNAVKYLITPLNGSGTTWVNESSIIID